MSGVWNSAIALLLVTGTMLGLNLPFGKLAADGGVSPILWAFIISAGASGVLLAVLLAQGGRLSLTAPNLRYFVVTAAVSYAIPNLLMFSAMPHLGTGYMGIMFTLSPVVTLVFSILLRVRRPTGLGVAGIAIGFSGAMMVAMTRSGGSGSADLFWIVIGLLMPVSLAVGNVYRTLDWPSGSGPIELAVGSHVAAAIMLLAGSLAVDGAGAFAALSSLPLLVVAQIGSAAAMYAFYFRLQHVGGPVYLSQISYVAAAIGLLSGMLVFGERYVLLTWLGAAIICVGVAMTTKAQKG